MMPAVVKSSHTTGSEIKQRTHHMKRRTHIPGTDVHPSGSTAARKCKGNLFGMLSRAVSGISLAQVDSMARSPKMLHTACLVRFAMTSEYRTA